MWSSRRARAAIVVDVACALATVAPRAWELRAAERKPAKAPKKTATARIIVTPIAWRGCMSASGS
jgi:hypothetical protein